MSWNLRQQSDPFVQQAKKSGYRSRASFKLIEIDAKFKFLEQSRVIADLGCSPGSWLQVVLEKWFQSENVETSSPNKPKRMLIGVDLLDTVHPMIESKNSDNIEIVQYDSRKQQDRILEKQQDGSEQQDGLLEKQQHVSEQQDSGEQEREQKRKLNAYSGVSKKRRRKYPTFDNLVTMENGYAVCHILKGDFLDESTLQVMSELLNRRRCDVVLSDMAAEVTGIRFVDHDKIMRLCEEVFEYCKLHLKRGGKMIVKIFQGGNESEFVRKISSRFEIVQFFKPEASRGESREMYLYASGFRTGSTNSYKKREEIEPAREEYAQFFDDYEEERI